MVRRTLRLPVGPEQLWPLMTDPSRASRWLGGRMDWEVVAGATLHFEPDGGDPHQGRIDAVEPARLLRWTWWPTADSDSASEVTWTLKPDEGEGTELIVTEAPAAPSSAPAASSVGSAGSAGSAGRWGVGDDALFACWAAQRQLSAARVG